MSSTRSAKIPVRNAKMDRENYTKHIFEMQWKSLVKAAFREFLTESGLILEPASQRSRTGTTPLIGTQEACRLLGGIDRHTLAKHTKTGELPAYKIGKSNKYKVAEIEEFLNKKNKRN